MHAIIKIASSSALNQVLVGICGFLIIRWVSKEEYAIYAITASFWGAITVISKAGINLGMSALLSKVHPDKPKIESVFASAMTERYFISKLVIPLVIAAYAYTVSKISSDYFAIGILCGLMLIYVYSDICTKLQEQLLVFLGDSIKIQLLDLMLAMVRLCSIIFILYIADASVYLVIGAAALVGVIKIPVIDRLIKVRFPGGIGSRPNEEYRYEIKKISRRQLPLEVFYIFQAQVVLLFTSSMLGSVGTADLGALTRIGQLLIPVSSVGMIYFLPTFLKEKEHLFPSLLNIGLKIGAVCFAFPFLVFLMPNIFLFILGDKYAYLGPEVVMYSVVAAVTTFFGALWQLAAHKGWNIYSIYQIPLFLAWVIMYFWFSNMETLMEIIIFQFGYPITVSLTTLLDLNHARRSGEFQ